MRLPSTFARAGTLGIALGAVAGCGDEPTRPARPATYSVARDIGDSTVVQGWAEDIDASGVTSPAGA